MPSANSAPQRGCSAYRTAVATGRRGRSCRCPASAGCWARRGWPMSVALGSRGAMTRASRPATTMAAQNEHWHEPRRVAQEHVSSSASRAARRVRAISTASAAGCGAGGGGPRAQSASDARAALGGMISLGHDTLAFGLSHPVSRSMTRLTITTSGRSTMTRPMTSGMSPGARRVDGDLPESRAS